ARPRADGARTRRRDRPKPLINTIPAGEVGVGTTGIGGGGVGVKVGVGVNVGDGVNVGVFVGVAVGVRVGVFVAVTVFVGVLVGGTVTSVQARNVLLLPLPSPATGATTTAFSSWLAPHCTLLPLTGGAVDRPSKDNRGA